MIQMQDLQDDIINMENLTFLADTDFAQRHFIRKGDIIFRTRGQKTQAAIVNESIKDVVASAALYIIRINEGLQKQLQPEFLHWWINQPDSQAFLKSRSKGTTLKMISRQDLRKLELSIPPLDNQNRIIEFSNLAREELQLLEKIKVAKNLLNQDTVLKMLLNN